jgi:hypothetical protein
MKNKKYHTVRTVLKYHTVRTVLKYHTVRTVLKYHTVRTVLKYHTVRTVLKFCRKIAKTELTLIPLIHIHDFSLSTIIIKWKTTFGIVTKSNKEIHRNTDKSNTPNTHSWLSTFLAWYRHFNKKWQC